MTISNETCSTELMLGDGLNVSWPFDFLIPEKSSITFNIYDEVTETYSVIPDNQFSILPEYLNNSSGGLIVYPLGVDDARVSSTQGVIITRDIPYSQGLSIGAQGMWSPVALTSQLDRIVMQTQQNRRDIDRSLKFPLASEFEGDLPAAQQGYYLGWGPSGNIVNYYPSFATSALVQYGTRASFVGAVSSGLTITNGAIYEAGGYFYRGKTGATDISDLPGLVPNGPIHVEHFNAVSDLTFTLTASIGYVKTGGTNNLVAFTAANAYAVANGDGIFCAYGNYFVDGGPLTLTATLQGNNFKTYLWVRYAYNQQGIYLGANDTFINNINVIGQYDREGIAKPTGNGQMGAIIGSGRFLTTSSHTKITNIGGDVRVCRAGNNGGQVSNSAWMIFVAGWVQNPRFHIGTHGYTNVTSNGLYIQHFGGTITYTTSPPAPEYIITGEYNYGTTYHPLGGHITFANPFVYSLDLFGHVWECASSGDTYFGPSTSTGMGGPFTIGVGDVTNHYAVAEDKDRVNKGIRAGRQVAYEVTGQTDWSDYGIYIKGRGESKATDDLYIGTALRVQRQGDCDIEVDGIYMTVASGSIPATSPGKPIFVEGLFGRCDLGDVWIYGSEISIERESGTGNLTYNFRGGQGTLKHEFARGGHILGSRVARGDTAGSGSGSDEEGYATDNRCVSIFGSSSTVTTTTADAAKGDTILPINAIGIDVYMDDPILLTGNYTVHCRAMIRDGVPYLVTTPLPAAFSSGTTVTIERRSLLDSFVGNYESSEDGLFMSNSTVYNADLTAVRFAGASAAKVDANSYLYLNGNMPTAVGQISPITSSYTIKIGTGSRVFANAMRIRGPNAGVTAHFWCEDSTANVVLTNCAIQSLSTLFDSGMKIDQGMMSGCLDFSGNQLGRHTICTQSAQPASGSVIMSKVVNYPYFQLHFTLIAARMTVTDAGVSGSSASLQLVDFAQGVIQMLGSRHDWTAFAEGAALTTAAGDAAFVIALGSVAADAGDGALTGTEVDFGATRSITLSGGTGTGATTVTGIQAPLDGTATAIDIFLNWSGTAATIDANSTIDVTGTVTINGMFIGDD